MSVVFNPSICNGDIVLHMNCFCIFSNKNQVHYKRVETPFLFFYLYIFSVGKLTTQIRPYSDVNKPSWIPFAKAAHGNFFQQPPELKNPWTHDSFANKVLALLAPPDVTAAISSDLTRFGDRIVSEIDHLGNECELNPPSLIQYNAWGRLTNELRTCQAWKDQKAISAEEGLVAIPYENRQREFSRLYQALKLYIYAPSSGLYSCPLAMTDGAAKCIKSLGTATDATLSNAYNRLTTRDPKAFWTSGQVSPYSGIMTSIG